MRNFLGPGVRRFIANCPVTTTMIAVAVVLWIGTEIWGTQLPRGIDEARGRLGAVGSFEYLRWDAVEGRMVSVPQTLGPYELWRGEWWRVFVSGFHHGGLLHLFLNGTALVFLGGLLEPRMGRWRYLVFFLTATAVSMLPEFLLDHNAVGLSGTGYTLFGALLVFRQRDWKIAEILSPAVVQFGFVWLFGCVVVTYLGPIPIANAAHFTGLIYGWVAGQVLFGRFASRLVLRWGFVAAHLLLIPGFYYVVHPFWNGTYLWHLAFREDDPDRRAELLKKVVQTDPSLRRAWDQWSSIQWENGEHELAWKTLLEGLRRNRSNEHGLQLARYYWQTLVLEGQQGKAEQRVSEVFGSEAATWQQRFAETPETPRTPEQLAAVVSLQQSKLKHQLQQVYQNTVQKNRDAVEERNTDPSIKPLVEPKDDRKIPPLDPNSADSASEGVQL